MLSDDGVEVLDVREAARLAHRSPETIRRWVWAGRLPARRRGNRLLLARADLEAIVVGNAAPSTAPDLAEWAALVSRHRADGLLGESTADGTARDLVLSDRAGRDA